MQCPNCSRKVSFTESLTILNPLNFRCRGCDCILSLNRTSLILFISILLSVLIMSFIIYKYVGVFGQSINTTIIIILVALNALCISSYLYFWKRANLIQKEEKSETLGC